MRLRRFVPVAFLAIAACATPAEKIARGLEAAGVPQLEARCMGDRLAERLSYAQLGELNRIVRDSGGQKLTVGRLVARLGDSDPALVSALVRTGLGCAI